MKKILYSLLAGFLLLGPLSCKKDDPAGPSLASTPEAEAANDNKSGGIYKGAIIGSSGTVKIVLQGGKKEIVLKIDGVTRTLTTTALDNWTSGQGITNATFTSGDWTVIVSLLPDGSGGDVAFNIPGHTDILVALLKERSTQLIMAYEGSYTGTDSGTWNFVVQHGSIYGISRSANGSATFTGIITNNTISVNVDNSEIVAAGTTNGNNVSGTWTDAASAQGAWTGTRTL